MNIIVRQERLDDAKRTRLMEAAIEEFSERGFEAASYNKIIERSGLSKGTVYYYFDNKDSLLSTVLDELCERFLNALGELKLPETKEDYWAVSWEYHRRTVRFLFENPTLSHLMFRLFQDNPNIDERFMSAHNRTTCFMDSLVVRGQEIGAIRSDLPVATIQKLMHATGKVLGTDLLGEFDLEKLKNDKNAQKQIRKFKFMMHDLTKRILSPEEVQDV